MALQDTSYDGLKNQYHKALCSVERSVGLVSSVSLWPAKAEGEGHKSRLNNRISERISPAIA